MTLEQLKQGNEIKAELERLDGLRATLHSDIRLHCGFCRHSENTKQMDEVIRILQNRATDVIEDLKKPLIEKLANL